jgi:hypothetical protein
MGLMGRKHFFEVSPCPVLSKHLSKHLSKTFLH